MTSSKTNFALVAALLTAALTGCKGDMKTKQAASDTTFVVDTVVVEKSAVGAARDNWNLPKQRTFSMKACLKDVHLGTALSGLNFSVTDEEGMSRTARTNQDGCMFWDETHPFTYLEQAGSFQVRRTFSAQEIHNGSKVVTLAMNPWSGEVDNLELSQPNRVVVSKQRVGFNSKLVGNGVAARIDIESMGLELDEVHHADWDVDKHLSVKVSQKYLVKLEPKILRKDADGAYVVENPSAGTLKVDLLVFRTSRANLGKNVDELIAENVPLVAQVTKDFSIDSKGKISSDFEVMVPADVAADMAASRLLTFVRLSAESEMHPTWTYGMVRSQKSPDVIQLQMVRSSEDEVQKQEEGLESKLTRNVEAKKNAESKQKTKAGMKPESVVQLKEDDSPLGLYKKTSGFRQLAFGKMTMTEAPGFFHGERKAVISTAELQSVIIEGKNSKAFNKVGKMLCFEVYRFARIDNGWITKEQEALQKKAFEACANNPAKHLGVQMQEFVEEVKGQPVQVGTNLETFVIETSYGLAETKTNTKTDKWWRTAKTEASVGLEAGTGKDGVSGAIFGIPLTAKVNMGVSAGTGAEWFYGSVHTVEEKIATNVTGASTTAVGVLSVNLAIKAKVRQCAVAVATPKLSFGMKKHADEISQLSNGVVLCAPQAVEKTKIEPYYFVNPSRGEATSLSNGDSLAAGLRQVIRGNEAYRKMRLNLKDKGALLVLNPLPKDGEAHDVDPLVKKYVIDNKMTQSFPGVCSQ